MQSTVSIRVCAAWLTLVLHAAARLSPDSDLWVCNPIQWSATPESLRSSGQTVETAVFLGIPVSARVTVEADVRVRSTMGRNWKVAAVGIYLDDGHFWHLALAEPPPDRGRRRFCELCEMRDGEWLAQANLRRTHRQIAPETWQTDQVYRLRIDLTPDGIEGTISDAGGTILHHTRYAFNAAAVTTGRPMLRCGGFDAEFKRIEARAEDAVTAAAATFPVYRGTSAMAGFTGNATGFFHVESHSDRWWAIDPLGWAFVPLGVDHVRYGGHHCEKLGYAPYGRENDRRYADREQWAQQTIRRLRSWGFNLLAAGASPRLFRRGLAHTRFLGIGTMMARMGEPFEITPDEGRPCTAFPNVFHPQFERFCAYYAERHCAPQADDPWLFGYFLDNELAWWGRGDVDAGLFDATMKKPADHTAKQALRDLMARRYDNSVQRFNAVWETEIRTFDDILTRTALNGRNRQRADSDKKAYLELAAERYFSSITRAVRAADPNHMILGCRFAGGHLAETVWAAAGRHCDVLTFNYYGTVDLTRNLALGHTWEGTEPPLADVFNSFHALGGRPMMLTEWSFPALDSGLPCTEGAGQRFRTQTERARASEIYARAVLALPFMIGFDYFMWVDEPALGISSAFPENSNYGLVDEHDQPYAHLVTALGNVNRTAGKLRMAVPKATQGPQTGRSPRPESSASTAVTCRNHSGHPPKRGPIWIPSICLPKPPNVPGLEMYFGDEWRPVPAQIMTRPERAASVVLTVSHTNSATCLVRPTKVPHHTSPASAMRYEFMDDHYIVETGAFRLAGRLGEPGLVGQVTHRGMDLGRYNAMLQVWTEQDRWIDAARLTHVSAHHGPLCLTLDLTGRRETDDPPRGEPPFEIAHRLTLFPDADWFVVELLYCRNTGARPLNIRAVFFRLYSAIAGSARGDRSIKGDVPRLWDPIANDAWTDVQVNAFWGCAAPGREPTRIHFWLNEHGGQHPDARQPMEITIAPGEVFRPAEPVFALVIAGRGDASAWQRQATEATNRVFPVHNADHP